MRCGFAGRISTPIPRPPPIPAILSKLLRILWIPATDIRQFCRESHVAYRRNLAAPQPGQTKNPAPVKSGGGARVERGGGRAGQSMRWGGVLQPQCRTPVESVSRIDSATLAAWMDSATDSRASLGSNGATACANAAFESAKACQTCAGATHEARTFARALRTILAAVSRSHKRGSRPDSRIVGSPFGP